MGGGGRRRHPTLFRNADHMRDAVREKTAEWVFVESNGFFGAGEHRDVGMKLGQRLDHGLVAADDLIDDQPDVSFADRDDDDPRMLVGRAAGVRQLLLSHLADVELRGASQHAGEYVVR